MPECASREPPSNPHCSSTAAAPRPTLSVTSLVGGWSAEPGQDLVGGRVRIELAVLDLFEHGPEVRTSRELQGLALERPRHDLPQLAGDAAPAAGRQLIAAFQVGPVLAHGRPQLVDAFAAGRHRPQDGWPPLA